MGQVQTLVIDDDPGVRSIIKDILSSQGVTVLVAATGKEGLEQLKSHPIDILFVDLRLPDWDGNSVIQQARWIRPGVRSVLLTGYPSLDSSIRAIQHGVSDYIAKPITREKIIAALSRATRPNQQARTEALISKPHQHASTLGNLDCKVVCESSAVRKVLQQTRHSADANVPLLILGERGVGKALVARYAHTNSCRADRPFTHVLCSGIREERLEELLSYDEPRDDGTDSSNGVSLLDNVRGGTLFLDGIDRLPGWAQTRLLNVLENDGGQAKPEVRVIATVSSDLEMGVREGRFLEALYFWLNVAPIWIPPLRHRREDIRPLAEYFLSACVRRLAATCEIAPDGFTGPAMEKLQSHDWPGNVRQLSHVVERAAFSTGTSQIEADSVGTFIDMTRRLADDVDAISVPLKGDLREIERNIIRQVIERNFGNKAAAARSLGMHRRTIYRLLEGEDIDSRNEEKLTRDRGQTISAN